MFLRILTDSLLRQKRRKAIVLVAVALGTAVASALGDIALDVGDKVNRELKSFGANLVVEPRGGSGPVLVGGEDLSALRVPIYLKSADVLNVKDNFWKNNILGFAPILDVAAQVGGRTVLVRGTWFERPVHLDSERGPAADATSGAAAAATAGVGAATASATPATLAGLRPLFPYWTVAGDWPAEPATPEAGAAPRGHAEATEALVGADLARRLGAKAGAALSLVIHGRPVQVTVAGIVSTGGEEDGLVMMPLEAVQNAAGLEGRVSRVLVSALTTPESAVYERLGANPRNLPPAEFEKWSCTPFVSSIAYELERAWPGSEARVIRRVAAAEGTLLSRASGLMAFIALLAALGAALTVASALTRGVIERRAEIGLLKAIGAGGVTVFGLFLSEAALLGVLGGIAGAGGGAILARLISVQVFGTPVTIAPMALALAVAAALLITMCGAWLPARRIARLNPAEVLRGR